MNDHREYYAIAARHGNPLEKVRTRIEKGERPSMTEVRELEAFAHEMKSRFPKPEFRGWLRDSRPVNRVVTRAAGEGTASAGGNLVFPDWNNAVVRQLHEFDSVTSGFEIWRSATGAAASRPVVTAATPGSVVAENTSMTESLAATFSQQAWGECPTYPAETYVSFALWNDGLVQERAPSFAYGGSGRVFTSVDDDSMPPRGDTEQLIISLLSESVGRASAPLGVNALYAGAFPTLTLGAATPVTIAGTASTELAQKTISIAATAPKIVAKLDPAYRANAKWFVSLAALQGLQGQTDSNGLPLLRDGMLLDYPIVVSNALTAHDAAASTVSGVVFGDLQAAMTQRVPVDVPVLRSYEARAEFAEVLVRVVLRSDFAVRDVNAAVLTKYAAT